MSIAYDDWCGRSAEYLLTSSTTLLPANMPALIAVTADAADLVLRLPHAKTQKPGQVYIIFNDGLIPFGLADRSSGDIGPDGLVVINANEGSYTECITASGTAGAWTATVRGFVTGGGGIDVDPLGYCFGWDSGNVPTSKVDTWQYDHIANQFLKRAAYPSGTLPVLSSPANSQCTQIANDKAYVYNHASTGSDASFHSYQASSNSWDPLTAVAGESSPFHVLTANATTVYGLGEASTGSGNSTKAWWKYTIATDSWEEQVSLLPHSLRGWGAIEHHNDQTAFILFGTLSGRSVFAFDLATEELEKLPDHPMTADENVTAFQLTGPDRILFSQGNISFPSGPPQVAVWELNMQNRGWSRKANINVPPLLSAWGVATGGKGYAIGGTDGTDEVDTVRAYDPEADFWVILPPPVTAGALERPDAAGYANLGRELFI